jgi:hypothetical protein
VPINEPEYTLTSVTANTNSNIDWGNHGGSWTSDRILSEAPFVTRSRTELRGIDLTVYTEQELRDFSELLAAYIDLKYPPKPPKFKSVEEADAWMEKHYGQ